MRGTETLSKLGLIVALTLSGGVPALANGGQKDSSTISTPGGDPVKEPGLLDQNRGTTPNSLHDLTASVDKALKEAERVTNEAMEAGNKAAKEIVQGLKNTTNHVIENANEAKDAVERGVVSTEKAISIILNPSGPIEPDGSVTRKVNTITTPSPEGELKHTLNLSFPGQFLEASTSINLQQKTENIGFVIVEVPVMDTPFAVHLYEAGKLDGERLVPARQGTGETIANDKNFQAELNKISGNLVNFLNALGINGDLSNYIDLYVTLDGPGNKFLITAKTKDTVGLYPKDSLLIFDELGRVTAQTHPDQVEGLDGFPVAANDNVPGNRYGATWGNGFFANFQIPNQFIVLLLDEQSYPKGILNRDDRGMPTWVRIIDEPVNTGAAPISGVNDVKPGIETTPVFPSAKNIPIESSVTDMNPDQIKEVGSTYTDGMEIRIPGGKQPIQLLTDIKGFDFTGADPVDLAEKFDDLGMDVENANISKRVIFTDKKVVIIDGREYSTSPTGKNVKSGWGEHAPGESFLEPFTSIDNSGKEYRYYIVSVPKGEAISQWRDLDPKRTFRGKPLAIHMMSARVTNDILSVLSQDYGYSDSGILGFKALIGNIYGQENVPVSVEVNFN